MAGWTSWFRKWSWKKTISYCNLVDFAVTSNSALTWKKPMKAKHSCNLAEKSRGRKGWPHEGMFRPRGGSSGGTTAIRGSSTDRTGVGLERGLEALEGNVCVLSTMETIGGFWAVAWYNLTCTKKLLCMFWGHWIGGTWDWEWGDQSESHGVVKEMMALPEHSTARDERELPILCQSWCLTNQDISFPNNQRPLLP